MFVTTFAAEHLDALGINPEHAHLALHWLGAATFTYWTVLGSVFGLKTTWKGGKAAVRMVRQWRSPSEIGEFVINTIRAGNCVADPDCVMAGKDLVIRVSDPARKDGFSVRSGKTDLTDLLTSRDRKLIGKAISPLITAERVALEKIRAEEARARQMAILARLKGDVA